MLSRILEATRGAMQIKKAIQRYNLTPYILPERITMLRVADILTNIGFHKRDLIFRVSTSQ